MTFDEIVRCDFCYAANAEWVYPCRDFTLSIDVGPGGILEETSGAAWAACAECADVIDVGSRERLARRAMLNPPGGDYLGTFGVRLCRG